LIDARRIALMKPGVIVINTSRGDIIDESALLAGLKDGRIGGAGLDVLTGEPEVINHPLRTFALDHDNVIITPHIGGFSPDAVRTVIRFSAEQIVRHLHGAAR
jgi:D-3-phosphoglycerate dehydrogenase